MTGGGGYMTSDMSSIAAKEFKRTLQELGGIEATSEMQGKMLGRRAALLVAVPAAWRQALGPMVTAEEARRALKLRGVDALIRMSQENRLIMLPALHGGWLLPRSQFSDQMALLPRLDEVIGTLKRVGVDDFGIASWLVTPQTTLEDVTPSEWLCKPGNPERVVTAAHRSAHKLSH
jgi:hypothetical protein